MHVQRSQLVLLAWICLILPTGLGAQDVIHFQNGDQLTGTIERLQRGVVVFSTSFFDGDALIDWRSVARIDSDRMFQFETSSGERFLGRIDNESIQSQGYEIRIITPEGQEQLFRQDEIVLATQTVEGLSGLLEVSVGAGLTLSKSNNQKQTNAEVDVRYQTPKYLATAVVSSIFSSQQDSPDTSRQSVTLGVSRKLSGYWSTSVIGDFLSSEEQQLDLRTVVGGGPTRTFKHTNRMILYSTFGAVWNSERYSDDTGNLPVNNQIEGLSTLGFNYFQFRMWTVDSTLRVFPSITTSGRVRSDWTTSLRLRLRRGKPLWWSFNQTINLDNKPPADTPKTDYVTSSALSWSFP